MSIVTISNPRVPAIFADSRVDPGVNSLTERERAVLCLLATGMADKEIARALTISRATASKHVGRILKKLGVPSRAAAAVLAVRRGLA
ncbi:MAG: hypothetical protein QOF33_4375 [Thermomicrobiales bacterium]|jgi:DNA-binding NarL/FixJ family response regulator|nr:hypothetical protein [Thermomicrobiales bacterium]